MRLYRLKPWLRRLHLWLALAASLPLLVIGATGALLVFPTWLHEVTSGVDYSVAPGGTPLTPLETVAALDRALPAGDRAERIVFPGTPTGVVTATTKESRSIVMNPYTGEVLLIEEDFRHTWYQFIMKLHLTLAAGEVGRWVVALSAAALVVLCGTGLCLWWPVGRWRLSYFLIAGGKGAKRFNYDLHRTVGFYSSAVMGLIALTGVAMSFPDEAQVVIHGLAWSRPMSKEPRKNTGAESPRKITPDEAVAAAQARVPGSVLYRLYPAVKPGAPYRVFLNPPESFHARYDEARLAVDADTGAVLWENSPATRSRGDAVQMWLLPLHLGAWGGVATQWIYLAATLCPLILAPTGGVLWWSRSRKLRRARQVGSTESSLAVPAPG